MKKLIAVISACALMFSLFTACGSQKTESAPSSTATATATATATKAEAKKVTLKLSSWQSGGENQKAWDNVAARYTKEFPNVTVVNEPIDPKQYQQIYKARLAAGEGFDVFSVYPADFASFEKAGYIAPLDDLTAVSGLSKFDLSIYKSNGKLYGLPLSIDGCGIIYNKDLFAKLGIAVPQTWTEFLTACEKIKAAGVTPFGMSVKETWITQFFTYQITKQLTQAKDKDAYKKIAKGEMKFVDTGIVEAYQRFLDFKNKGYFSKDAMGIDYAQSKAEFAQGKSAMFPGALFFTTEIRAINPGFEIGFMEFPTSDVAEENKSIGWGGLGMSLSATAGANKEEAKQFVNWFLGKGNYEGFINDIKWLPVLDGIDVSKIDPLANEITKSLLARTKLFGSDADEWLPGVQDAMFKKMQEAYIGKATAEDIAKAMDEANKRAMETKK